MAAFEWGLNREGRLIERERLIDVSSHKRLADLMDIGSIVWN